MASIATVVASGGSVNQSMNQSVNQSNGSGLAAQTRLATITPSP